MQELAARVALDVDQHSSQVEEINVNLTAADKRDLAMIIGVVAKLMRANQVMRANLSSTEDKLRELAQQIHVTAAETRTDALTLIANGRALDDELARLIVAFDRYGRTFSLIMADVDCFKKFNYTYGRPAGDTVLRGLAELLRRKLRKMDIVARYGGEEFAILLPLTNLDDASKVAARACEAVEKCLFRRDGRELRVTMSFGVAEVLDSEEAAMLIARAKMALAAAKENGGNCAYWHNRETVDRVAINEHRDGPSRFIALWHETVDRVVGNHGRVVLPSQGQAESGSAPGEPNKNEKAAPTPDASAPEPKLNLRAAVETDAVSGLPSRAVFCQQVRARTAEWKRGGPTFSVALIEVDQHRQAGKHNSQQVGEATTRAATSFLAATIRETDTVGHYGPGCFALLLPTAGLAAAIGVAERIRQGFSQHSLSTQTGPARLTFSVGVVQVREKDDSGSLFQRAEAALDAANRGGGDRAYYHDGERCCSATWRFGNAPR